MIHVSATLVLAGCVWLGAAAATSQSLADSEYTEVFYPSGSLSIHAYLYKPQGDGPFPVVIYNHGARSARPRRPEPNEYIGRVLTRAGYLVLIPERRGYGDSDGPTLMEDIRNDWGQRFVARVEAETDDVFAAVDYLRALPFANTKRIGIMGYSLGGIVTMFAVSRSTTFAVAVNQAGAAGLEHQCTVAQRAHRRSWKRDDARALVGGTERPHHCVTAQGMHVWEREVLEFLARYLGGASIAKPSGPGPAKSPQ